ncbi:Sua5 YciO YrdC YwlC family protein [Campylobacter sp. CCUG 57310]|uniref:Sua5 YciO YrdC YwlC family protein n=1 Tax=Campylobacter sp. CCUG 57310 TaxID=2517362 RepID=UPI001563A87A|nr:Sua5 YciO YrdC YwlC family protein [Campylobacter sp. CCUG 57310]QKF92916.1 threonylcarbamoyl-AMP synthase TsaC [Campylobacter sp. CCUG 57310]
MIYLAQTDTTAGFLSKDFNEINRLKNRPLHKPCLITTSKFSELKTLVRVPDKFKNLVRRARKTTFLYPNLKAVRVVKECAHAKFLDQNGWFYSSSANLSSEKFDEAWARSVADVVVDENFQENSSSKIYKLSKINLKKIR